jgi:hypothetical protein
MAAVYTNNYMPGQRQHKDFEEHEKEKVAVTPDILESYHYVKKQRYVDEMRANNAKIFLDSGAFSAYFLGVPINIDDYCNYVKQNSDILRNEDGWLMYSVLDGIGNPLLTFQNQQYMERKGLKPLPCFHFGEDPKYLEWYIKYYPYITIGGLVGKSRIEIIKWMDEIWNKYLVDGSGNPKLKVHAFGVTAVAIIERYPWYSVDSSAWVQGTSFGYLITSEFANITVSDKSPQRKVLGNHFSTYTEQEQKRILQIIESGGFNFERLSTFYQSRAAFNLWSSRQINEKINNNPSFEFLKNQTLF